MALCGIFQAMFGLYMLTYNTSVMPEKLTGMFKWRISIWKVRVMGMILLLLGILVTLESFGAF